MLLLQRLRRLALQGEIKALCSTAGAWCDLCLWALAIFAWRLTLPDSLLNYLAWVVLTVIGGAGVLQPEPLLKLDGYYLLGDWLEVPNLRQRLATWRGTSGCYSGPPRPAPRAAWPAAACLRRGELAVLQWRSWS